MESSESIQSYIKSVLALQMTVAKPSVATCTAIAHLKELVDLQGPVKNDWRGRSFPDPGSPNRFQSVSSAEAPRKPSFHSSQPRVAPVKPFNSSDLGGSPPPPVVKYQSKFKNTNQPVEDKILNNIIKSKLNKFSPKTYDEIRDFLYQILGSGEAADLQEMIRDFMRLVFRKAAIEEMFCPLYAKLLCEISVRYQVILQEMSLLQSNYLQIFDNVLESESNEYSLFVEAQKNKQYRLGYSQFLAELTALEILDLDLLNSTFKRILSTMEVLGKEEDKKTLLEEYSDCLFRMAKVLKKKQAAFFVRARSTLMQANEKIMNELIDNHTAYPSETAKTRFILMEVHDILRGL
jgi:hypothetical protein